MSHRSRFRRSALVCLLGAALTSSAFATSFNFRMVSPGLRTAAPSMPAAPATPLSMSLAAASLPNATRSAPYSFDFSTLLTMSGDGQPSASQVSWSTSGAVPAGLSLGADGVLSGTPTALGSGSFTVTAAYTDKSGQQVYTLLVNGVPLDVVQISAGNGFTCAVTTAGAAKCWGGGGYGRLGDGNSVNSAVPVTVLGLSSGVSAIATGHMHACAVTSGGALKCWGRNTWGQLGDGTTVDKPSPVTVTGLASGVASVAASLYSTCAVTTAGAALCWGGNDYAGLGDGTTVAKSTPVAVSGKSSGVAKVAVGPLHTCAVSTTGGLSCWGANYYGQIGDGTTSVSRTTPVAVSGLASGVTSVSIGNDHSCAVASGAVKCWGFNGDYQLGDGTTTNRLAPVTATGLGSGMVRVGVGFSYACATTTAGAVKCWGKNDNGQLGDGTITTRPTAVSVVGLAATASPDITLGYQHACALPSSGPAQCWGANGASQLGDGTSTTPRLAPVNVLQ